MIDGATDASGKENKTIHCRFVKDGVPTSRLVDLSKWPMHMHKVTFLYVRQYLEIQFKMLGLAKDKAKKTYCVYTYCVRVYCALLQ